MSGALLRVAASSNYNGMKVIDDCLRAVLGQMGNIAVEILVHDDASTEGSAAYICKNYSDVVLIESDINVVFCIANNRIIIRARSRFVLLLMLPSQAPNLQAGRPELIGIKLGFYIPKPDEPEPTFMKPKRHPG